jgi:triacylglycerol lipase
MRHILFTVRCVASLATWHANAASSNPTVTLSIGVKGRSAKTTFVGRSLPSFDQEVFLGIKYTDQPTRFTPSSLKTVYSTNDRNAGPWASTSSATVLDNAIEYGYDCPGYRSDTTKLLQRGLMKMGEDCLNLNIIRPRTETGNKKLLPVIV